MRRLLAAVPSERTATRDEVPLVVAERSRCVSTISQFRIKSSQILKLSLSRTEPACPVGFRNHKHRSDATPLLLSTTSESSCTVLTAYSRWKFGHDEG